MKIFRGFFGNVYAIAAGGKPRVAGWFPRASGEFKRMFRPPPAVAVRDPLRRTRVQWHNLLMGPAIAVPREKSRPQSLCRAPAMILERD